VPNIDVLDCDGTGQLVVQACAEKDCVRREVDRLPVGVHDKKGFRQSADFDRPAVPDLCSLRPGINLESRPLPRIQKGCGWDKRDAVERNLPGGFVRAVDGPLVRVFLVVHEVFAQGRIQPASAYSEPGLRRRRKRQREILFGRIFRGVVEDIRVHTSIRQRECGIDEKRTEVHPHVRGRFRLSERTSGCAQEKQNSGERLQFHFS